MPSKPPADYLKCKNCNKQAVKNRTWQLFCSKACRYYYNNHYELADIKTKKTTLTKNELDVLVLIKNKELYTVRQMYEHIYINRSNLYRVLTSLEYKGYIEKLSTQPTSWKYLGEP